MTRGLALRSFTSLRLESVTEYLPAVIAAGLKDASPYVRKTAVMACVKLHRMSPEALVAGDTVNTLYNMLRDRDPQVVCNCICAINEILQDEGGMAINKPIIHHLLNRMREFNEWSQCIVLELVAKYKPDSQQETFDMMNVLEERLKHSNSAVVLATTKVFLHLTQDMPAVHSQVYARLKAPMLTLMTGGVFEQGFVCLKHIALLTTRAPSVFADVYKHFYCRYNDPACVKLLKLEILTTIATASTVGEITEELAEYVTDPDNNVARGTVAAIGKMGVKVPECASIIVEQLMKFLEIDIDYVSAEAITSMQNLLRKYPAVSDRIVNGIGSFLKSVDEPEAKKALLWMLAEYGHVISEAPYLIEPLIDNFAEETTQEVRLELLAAATKLFFRRPAEMQHMLGRLLDAAISDVSFSDVHDRALLYYRLLQHDVHKAKAVLTNSAAISGSFVEEAPSEVQDRIFEEFNTLSVIYGEPGERFITNERALSALSSAGARGGRAAAADAPASVAQAEGAAAGSGGAAAADDSSSSDEDDSDEEDEVAPVATAPPPAAPPQPSPMDDLLGLLDDLPTAPVAPPAAPPLALSPAAALDAATFQQQWAVMPVAESWTAIAASASVADVLQQRLGAKHLKCMAFGTQGDVAKFYFYGEDAATRTVVLVELQLAKSSRQANAVLKSPNPAMVPAVSAALKSELATP